ncbi:CAZyme family GT8 [Penicillium brevicompactum]|uniref:CAZyme family GT8 n=1 Tax=Penicillium brevicompactum TaxID=5074 RepID=UPI0025408642|nr:CAZyme family GT8 [Penicillium brevicompactum]KAJ5319313.1 CAZyme family GT8 [Penicillium brevicompactum]
MLSMVTLSPRLLRVIFVLLSFFLGYVTLSQLPHTSNFLSHASPALDLLHGAQVDWSRFAYTQYATDRSYLCNSLMIFEALHRLGSKPDRVLLYSSEFNLSEDDDSKESHMLRFARDNYGVKLKPIQVQLRGGDGAPWAKSYTKLLAFNQTEYDRVLNLDSDATLFQSMDELFLMPSSPIAMPRAYWKDASENLFTSALILTEPSAVDFNQMMEAIFEANYSTTFDMEILNNLYGPTALTIPHRPYILLSGELRSDNHAAYLGNTQEIWNSNAILQEAKYVHFSDWPVPKPWFEGRKYVIEEAQPRCAFDLSTGRQDDCRTQKLWLGLYDDFRLRRKVVNGLNPSFLVK